MRPLDHEDKNNILTEVEIVVSAKASDGRDYIKRQIVRELTRTWSADSVAEMLCCTAKTIYQLDKEKDRPEELFPEYTIKVKLPLLHLETYTKLYHLYEMDCWADLGIKDGPLSEVLGINRTSLWRRKNNSIRYRRQDKLVKLYDTYIDLRDHEAYS